MIVTGLVYIAFFSFYIDQVIAGGYGIGLVKGLSLFNLCLYSLLFVWIFQIVKRKRIFLYNHINIYLILMCCIILLSTFVKIFHAEMHVSVVRELVAFKRWINPILLFWILFNIIDDERVNNNVLFGLGIFYIAVIVAQILAIQGVTVTDYQADKIARIGRIGGMGAAGEYSIMLSLFFPFTLSVAIFIKTTRFKKYFFSFLSFFMLLGYAFAGSRNGLLTLLIATVLYFIIIHRFLFIRIYWIFLLLLALIGAGYASFIISPESVQEAVTAKFEHKESQSLESYSSGRTRIWENGWGVFFESPIFGHGKGTFIQLLKHRGYRAYAPHNEYLKHLVEFGVVGLSVFLLLYLKVFQGVWRALQVTTSRTHKIIYSSYLAGMFSYMVGMFFTNTAVSLYIFWIYTAIVYKYIQLEHSEQYLAR